jgi:hypothetical protein
MPSQVRTAAAAACSITLLLPIGDAAAQQQPASRFEVGARAGMLLGDGKPANDIGVTGLNLRWRLDEQWSVQFGVQRHVFDAERPAGWLGLKQDPDVEAIDAKAKATAVSVGLRRDHGGPGSRWGWFWNLDLGTAKPKVPTVSGPLDGGGTFEVSTRAKREWIVGAGAGVRYQFSPGWAGEFGLQAEHHQANWRVTDAVSGRSGKVGAYQAAGLWLGLALAF